MAAKSKINELVFSLQLGYLNTNFSICQTDRMTGVPFRIGAVIVNLQDCESGSGARLSRADSHSILQMRLIYRRDFCSGQPLGGLLRTQRQSNTMLTTAAMPIESMYPKNANFSIKSQ